MRGEPLLWLIDRLYFSTRLHRIGTRRLHTLSTREERECLSHGASRRLVVATTLLWLAFLLAVVHLVVRVLHGPIVR